MAKSFLLWIVNIAVLSISACILEFIAIHVIWKLLILIFVYFVLLSIENYLFEEWFSWSEVLICTIGFVVIGVISSAGLWIYGDYIAPKLASLSGNPDIGIELIFYGILLAAFVGVVMISYSSLYRLKNWRKKWILDKVIRRVEVKVDREVNALVQERLTEVTGNWLKKQMIAQKLTKDFKAERMKPYYERRKVYKTISGKWESVSFWGLILLMIVLAPVISVGIWILFNYLSLQ